MAEQKVRYKKSFVEALIELVREAERRKIKPFRLQKNPEKNLNSRAVSVGDRARLSHAQNWSW